MNLNLLSEPIIVLLSLIVSFILTLLNQDLLSNLLAITAIVYGSKSLVVSTWESLKSKNLALDYIAILAILTGLFSGNFLVALVIVLMMSGGNTLERFAKSKASTSLKNLISRLPKTVEVLEGNKQFSKEIDTVAIGSIVLVRKGEVVPLDGVLLSARAMLDESSLTGESLPNLKRSGNLVKSGTVNVGNVLTLKTTVTSKNSVYSQIVRLVKEAQSSKAPLTRLADSLSGWFTLFTLLLCSLAYYLSPDINRILAILVIATPCPLILAAPIAFIGGINSAAKKRIIIKNISALESLAKVNAMVFDKTGTLTFGYPELQTLTVISPHFTKKEILKIASGLEINSLHPYARSLVNESKKQQIIPAKFLSITEEIGKGIKGIYKGSTFSLLKNATDPTKIILLQKSKKIATFSFVDKIKPETISSLKRFSEQKIKLHIFTGDTKEKTKQITDKFSFPVEVHADCTPKSKQAGIKEIKENYSVAMVGDGINDAPALALADVGLAFSHHQQTASTEAADIVLVGSNFDQVLDSVKIAKNTLKIAKQSMYAGVILSLLGMVFAFLGLLNPLTGSLTQEIIDVAVILNALRAIQAPH